MTTDNKAATILKKPVDKLLLAIAAAVRNWEADNTPEKIKQSVKELLDSKKENLVAKLLGFTDMWGRGWELDHCNGRNKESVAGVYIKTHAEAAVQQFLSEISIDACITPALKKKLAAEYKREFEMHVFDRMRTAARKHLDDQITLLTEELSKSDKEEAFFKMQALIEGTLNEPQN